MTRLGIAHNEGEGGKKAASSEISDTQPLPLELGAQRVGMNALISLQKLALLSLICLLQVAAVEGKKTSSIFSEPIIFIVLQPCWWRGA